MKSFKYIFLYTIVTLFFTSCSIILNFQDLPTPNGEYIVGTDLFDWEDTFRDEWFTKDKIDTRKIVVQIWYPASEKSDSLYPYMDYPEIRINSISKRINKPKGFVATTQGGKIKKSVQELIRSTYSEIIPPIGDMGRAVTGLLLMTNDETIRKKMADSRSRYSSLYQVILEQNVKTTDLNALIKGVRIQDMVYKVKSAAYIQGGSKKEIGIQASNLSPGLLQKILEQRSMNVLSMDRVLLAGLTKKDLPRGRWRSLTKLEIKFLKMIP